MLTIKILGAHCFSCEWLAQATQEVLAEMLLGQGYEMQLVTDWSEIAAYGVLRLPALVINDRVMCAGRLPRREQIVSWIRQVQEAHAPESDG